MEIFSNAAAQICLQSTDLMTALPEEVEIVDMQQGERTAEIKGLLEPQSVYYDTTTRRLYVATGGEGKLRVYEGKSLTLQDTMDYVVGGEGAVEVFRQRDPTNYERVERITTAPGARTGLFVSAWHRLFVAAPRRGSDSAKLLI